MKLCVFLLILALAISDGASSLFKRAPVSGVPIVAPPPKVQAFDESSATLTRHRMSIYGNGFELTKVYVFVKREDESDGVETEYPASFPLRISGLEKDKKYTFAWRFANEKGAQPMYSRPSYPIVTAAPGLPMPPKELFMRSVGEEFKVAWRHVEANGRPIMKYNVRIMNANTGSIIVERAVLKRFTAFNGLDVTIPMLVDVNVVTSVGVSQWSTPYLFAPNTPSIFIEGSDVFDIVTVLQLNVTSPGAILCSLYGPTQRPVHKEMEVVFAGHAHMALDVEPSTSYSVECSLNVNGQTVHSMKRDFVTPEHTQPHLAITDIEPFSSFARVSVASNVPGYVRCMPIRREYGSISDTSFARFAHRFQILDTAEPHTFVATDLEGGNDYSMRCAMEHELLHRDSHSKGRHLQDDITISEDFTTLEATLAVPPRVLNVSPDSGESIRAGSVVIITFDTPIVLGTGGVFVGDSVDQTTAMTVQSVSGVFMSVLVPAITGDKVYLKVAAGAVKSAESGEKSEEFKFGANVYWNVDTSSSVNQCALLSNTIPPIGGIVRFSCMNTVVLPETCSFTVAGEAYARNDIHISGKLFAFTIRKPLTAGTQLTITIPSSCLVSSPSGLMVSEALPIPTLESVQPASELLAGQPHHFTLTFDYPFQFKGDTDSVYFGLLGVFKYMPPLEVAPVVNGNSLEFDYPIDAEWEGETMIITIDRTSIENDVGNSLVNDVVIYRTIGGLCGPSYLSEKTEDVRACKCKRSAEKCECQCGSVVGVVEF